MDSCAEDSFCGGLWEGQDPYYFAEQLFSQLRNSTLPCLARLPTEKLDQPPNLYFSKLLGLLLESDQERVIIAPLIFRLLRCNEQDVLALSQLITIVNQTQVSVLAPGFSWILFLNVALSEMYYPKPIPSESELIQQEEEVLFRSSLGITVSQRRLFDVWDKYPMGPYQGLSNSKTTICHGLHILLCVTTLTIFNASLFAVAVVNRAVQACRVPSYAARQWQVGCTDHHFPSSPCCIWIHSQQPVSAPAPWQWQEGIGHRGAGLCTRQQTLRVHPLGSARHLVKQQTSDTERDLHLLYATDDGLFPELRFGRHASSSGHFVPAVTGACRFPRQFWNQSTDQQSILWHNKCMGLVRDWFMGQYNSFFKSKMKSGLTG